MRFSLVALSAVLAVASAQNLGDIPTCALSCFAVAVPASGCSLTDQKCQCTTGKSAIEKSITECVPGKCSADDIAKLAPAVTKLCAAAGVTVSDLPTAVSSGAGSTAGATKTGASSATSGAASSTSSAPAQSTGGAGANGVGFGAVALGLAAAML